MLINLINSAISTLCQCGEASGLQIYTSQCKMGAAASESSLAAAPVSGVLLEIEGYPIRHNSPALPHLRYDAN